LQNCDKEYAVSEFNPLGFAQILFAADEDLSPEVVLEFVSKHRPVQDQDYPLEVLDYYQALQFCQTEAAPAKPCRGRRSVTAI
jgi:hypothetical protein